VATTANAIQFGNNGAFSAKTLDFTDFFCYANRDEEELGFNICQKHISIM